MVHCCLEKLRVRAISQLCHFSWLHWALSSQWAKNLFVRAAKLYSTDNSIHSDKKVTGSAERNFSAQIACKRFWLLLPEMSKIREVFSGQSGRVFLDGRRETRAART